MQRLDHSRQRAVADCGIFSRINHTLSHFFSIDTSSELIFVPYFTGFSDRILAIATLFLLSIGTRRTFRIAHSTDLAIKDLREVFNTPSLENIFIGNIPKWAEAPLMERRDPLTKLLNFTYDKMLHLKSRSYVINAIDDNNFGVLLKEASIKVLLNRTAYKSVYVSLNHGLVLKLFYAKYTKDLMNYVNVSDMRAFGCAVNFLFSPKYHIFKRFQHQADVMMSGIRHSLGTLSNATINIAIHIRIGDSSFDSTTDHSSVHSHQNYFSCADEIEKKYINASRQFTSVPQPLISQPPVFWHLFTDSLSLRNSAIKVYGKKVISTLISPEHSSGAKQYRTTDVPQRCTSKCVTNEGFENAVAEWWLMGEADFFVIGDNSGYGKSAAFRNYKPNTVYTVPRLWRGRVKRQYRFRGFCKLDDFKTFEEFSGL